VASGFRVPAFSAAFDSTRHFAVSEDLAIDCLGEGLFGRLSWAGAEWRCKRVCRDGRNARALLVGRSALTPFIERKWRGSPGQSRIRPKTAVPFSEAWDPAVAESKCRLPFSSRLKEMRCALPSVHLVAA
jgi:hypothetical protein